ncbi:MAG: InlB B-repeat-containing protein [Bacteroidaceae bacterium]|nr:InlB B-repeat-containing protein [Bacteroidaceae bacterium]
MKRFISILIGLLSLTVAFSQLNGDGYYRIRNVGSQRYIVVTDNKGSVDIATTSADLGAVKLIKDFSNVVSEPGSVLYVNEENGQYRFVSQGTDTHEIIGYDLKLKKNADGSYKAYQEYGTRLYLCDARKEDTVDGVLSTRSDASNYRDWNILPLNTEENYFGISPEFFYAESYYSTIYASFPFTFKSAGMQAYYVSMIENGIAVLSEIVDNIVPASVPVIIKSSSNLAENNRLNIADNKAVAPKDNQLQGVYFHNTSRAHNNLTPYKPETMRVLGLTSSGKLGFIKADIDYLPANKAYLNVSEGTPDELEVMTKQEYEAFMNRTVNVVVTAEEGGAVTGSGTYKVNTLVTLTAFPSEGFHFSGWSDGTNINPYTFKVDKDISLVAKFERNEYKLTYILNGEEYASYTYLFGKEIAPLASLEKEGYTFSGWSEIPATMPAHDVTVVATLTPNIYQITYMVDGEVYKIDSLACDAPFRAEPIPFKEGYNFIGWDNIPSVMPAHDIVLTGSFVVNNDQKYNLIYMVDGLEYKRVVLGFGEAIVLEEEPVKEGHTFSGWSDVPATMPMHDVIVIGEFTVNSYTITYMVDGQVYAIDTLTYGQSIVLRDAPIKEGYNFEGWSDVPTTMPMHDVTVVGEFTVNSYTITYMVDGQVYAIDTLTYGQSIVLRDAPIKEGYNFEGWSDAPTTMPAKDLILTAVYITNGINDLLSYSLVDVYTLQGVRVRTQILMKEVQHELPSGIYIVNGRKLLIK